MILHNFLELKLVMILLVFLEIIGVLVFKMKFLEEEGIPYSRSRKIKGGIPASICMEEGWLHGSYVKLEN